MAKKSKKSPRGNRVQAKLPAGFTATAASGDFGDWHDFTRTPKLTGKVVETGKYKGEFGVQRTLTIQNGKVLSTISESKGLKGLFDTKGIKGKTVFVQFLGSIKVGKPNRKGLQKTFKQFLCGVK